MPPYLYEIRGRISLLLFLRLLRFRILKAVSAIAHPPVFCLSILAGDLTFISGKYLKWKISVLSRERESVLCGIYIYNSGYASFYFTLSSFFSSPTNCICMLSGGGLWSSLTKRHLASFFTSSQDSLPFGLVTPLILAFCSAAPRVRWVTPPSS